jgi:hypothetical protein
MLNTSLRPLWFIGAWVAAVAVIVAGSMAMGANLSTTALLLALGIAPGIVTAILAQSQPSPRVAQILHPVEAKDRRP